MDKQKLKRMVRGALLAAIVAAMTMLIKLPVPATGGYVHPGDGAIFLAAYLMGPWAAIPAALGSALADILGGYAVYAIPTALIKGAMGWIAGRLIAEKKKIYKGVSPNVDFYSGLIYRMLDLPGELYTPIFAMSRIAGWSAHRIEEIQNSGKIIRPAYINVKEDREYRCLADR